MDDATKTSMDNSITKMEEALAKKKAARIVALNKRITNLESRCTKKNQQKELLTVELIELDDQINQLKQIVTESELE